MQLFYKKSTSNEVILDSQESHHAINVLRKKEGDVLNFTDGIGNLLIAEIIIANKKETKLQIIRKEKKKKKHNYHLHIAIAPTKNIDRFEWFLEKATEIGVDEITPLICERSERKIIKIERCNRIIASAMKQSLRFYLPRLNKTTNFEHFINNPFNKNKYIAHCKNTKNILLRDSVLNNKTLILIGPEGDFTQEEIERACENEYKEVTLGDNRLRTETAGIVAVNTINIKNQ